MHFVQELIGLDRPNRSRSKITPKFITIHNTGNTSAGANAQAHSRFVRSTGYYDSEGGEVVWVSWHFTVDDALIIQHLPVREMGFHARRAGNLQSVGIEICMNRGIDQGRANQNAADLASEILQILALDVSCIRTHKSWTGKNCPQLLTDGNSWGEFVALVGTSKGLKDCQIALEADVLPPERSPFFRRDHLDQRIEGELDHQFIVFPD
jgi:N-acetylmuramoyl-L-alanine amidase